MKKSSYVLICCVTVVLFSCQKQEKELRYIAAAGPNVVVYEMGEDNVPVAVDVMTRGEEVVVFPGERVKYEKQKYVQTNIGRGQFYVLEDNTVSDRRECVKEEAVWVRTPASVIDDTLASHICGLAEKGKQYEVVGYDNLLTNGKVRRYRIVCGKDTGWLYGKYTVFSEEEARERYMAEKYDSIHINVRNTFGGGEAIGCDYYPVEKPDFTDNKMPGQVYSLYLNIS